jgi:hypothetical protein
MPINIADLLPSSFPTQNAHRLVVVNAEAQPDEFARLEITTADALAAARGALRAFEDAPIDDRALQRAVRALADQVSKGRVLGDGFRDIAAEVLNHLARLEGQASPQIARIQRSLGDALTLSYRVSDLLAAERDIDRHRGITRDQ